MTAVDVNMPAGTVVDGAVFARRVRAGDHTLDGLAAAWPAVTPDRAALAAADAADIRLDDGQRLEFYQLIGAELAEQTERSAELADTLDIYLEAVDHEPATFQVDPSLDDLALLPLARDIARGEPTGSLTIRDVPAQPLPGVTGLFMRGPAGTLNLLHTHGRTAEQVDATFAHELAHLLDPHTTDRPSAEAFVDRLAPLLLEHQPTTTAHAAPLVAATLVAVRPHPRPAPATRTVAAVVGWALDQILAQEGR